MQPIDGKIVTALRVLAIDQIEAAKSGHPGLPLGAAPLMYAIWKKLRHNPRRPQWADRDRFVLSAGHGSALYYAMLHLSGFDLPLEELKQFRQWGSRTPGHPEYGHTVGVEATTGPLGHGFAMGVGLAVAEKMLAAHYNRPGFPIVDHYVYALVSDGDLMEGVAAEAASLAGTLGLGKIIYLYDDNKITIEGSTELSFSEDVKARFDAYGWHTVRVPETEDTDTVERAIDEAKKVTDKPSLIIARTHIGFASPREDSAAAHGEPLGPEDSARTKEKLGAAAPPFTVDEEIRAFFALRNDVLAAQEQAWQKLREDYERAYPALAAELTGRWAGKVTVDWTSLTEDLLKVKEVSTREASGAVLQKLACFAPALAGGSADLAPSNKTYINGAGDFSKENPAGRNVRFGVREHAMAAIANGLALHGGFIPYCATFLVFADFMRPAIRLAALMRLKTIFILTHDSIAVGEDGPTHQPVEQTMSLRLIPGLTVLRPADALETAECWRLAIEESGPAALLLTRQKLPVFGRFNAIIDAGAARGGYIISSEKAGSLDLTMIATGSEVALALAAQEALTDAGVNTRVVSLPSWELFDRQPDGYRSSVTGSAPVLAVEAGVAAGWIKYTHDENNIIAVNQFGSSAPGEEVYAKFGFTVDALVAKARRITGK